MASKSPLNAPYFSIASIPYLEQLGKYGHLLVFMGEIYF
jgi:hypothetical protein